MSYKNGDTVVAICNSYMYKGTVVPPTGSTNLTLALIGMCPTSIEYEDATWVPLREEYTEITLRLDMCEAVVTLVSK